MELTASGFEGLLSRREASSLQQFWSSPLRFFAEALYSTLAPALPVPKDGIRVVCISDTHNTQPELPNGDVLLHAGDLTQSGSPEELRSQIEWLDLQPHKFKVVIGGNHDLCLDDSKKEAYDEHRHIDWRSLIYLKDESVTLRLQGGRPLKIYGSPWTPKHGNWAFQYPRAGPDPWKGSIPDDIDILLTHGPAKHHLDLGYLGCEFLLQEVHAKTPPLHVFGHIHAGYGRRSVVWDDFEMAYERAIADDASWFDLARMLIFGAFRMRRNINGVGPSTVFVNASAIGGFRDEERREAITVVL